MRTLRSNCTAGIAGIVLLMISLPPFANAADNPVIAPLPTTAEQLAAARQQVLGEEGNFRDWALIPIAGGDDSPYIAVTRDIDTRIAKGEPLSQIMDDYRKSYFSAPTNPSLLAGYAYAGYRMETAVGSWEADSGQNGPDMLWSKIANKTVDMSHTYSAARIVFLCSASPESDDSIKELGLSLLRRDPNDQEVQFCLARYLDYSDFPEDRKAGAVYLKEIVREHPKDPRNYLPLGSQQLKLALISQSITNAENCTAFCRRYLDSEPQGSPDIQTINEKIQIVNNLIKKWASQRTIGGNQ